MAVKDIRTALSPVGGMKVQTTKLADNIQSMTTSVGLLQQTVTAVQSGDALVRQKLGPILTQSVVPLLRMGQSAETVLSVVAGDIRQFIGDVQTITKAVESDADTPAEAVLQIYLAAMANEANMVQSSAKQASTLLTSYKNTADQAEAALNTYSQTLIQQDKKLAQEAANLRQQMHDMTSGNCCKQIGHAFQMAFGHLKRDLEEKSREIRQLEYVVAINEEAVSGLTQMVQRLADISSVASALQVSWESVSVNVSGLGSDLATVLKDTTRAELQGDLAYVNSDWQAILATLNKIT
ncbi:hypothetical protein [Sagittula sp. S175]|uniref:hypothetical protein n=1 Tax=Sagittula sp. S175 TaxID=3415129 RepID=UPI003C7ABBA7